MFNNLLKHSLRSFKRQRAYITINILGLSIGIACSLLIALFVINEASYDTYNVKKDRIFRAVLNGKIGGQEVTTTSSPAVMGPTMLKEFPEIEDFLECQVFLLGSFDMCQLHQEGKIFRGPLAELEIIDEARQQFSAQIALAIDNTHKGRRAYSQARRKRPAGKPGVCQFFFRNDIDEEFPVIDICVDIRHAPSPLSFITIYPETGHSSTGQ